MAGVMTLPFLNASPIKSAGKKSKANKGHTVAERVLWMSRTSDVFGSHTNKSIDAYTTLIRRKVQERCRNTQELMSTIRRMKIGDSGHVTPNEFRLTLLKFGINLPSELVAHIFDLFDTDRSGTIDFDEFAMWIMNSEFRPVSTDHATDSTLTPSEALRHRLAECMKLHPRVFDSMKAKINFLEFVSDTTRMQMSLTDKDVRAIFQILDPEETGLLDTTKMRRWVNEGRTDTPPPSAKPFVAPDLRQAIARICGKNTDLLAASFSHLVTGNGLQITYDEFRRCLLAKDLGRNQKDVQNLFLAVGGNRGKANIDYLLSSLEFPPDNPATMASKKVAVPLKIPHARADRLLRDSIRKTYKQVESTLLTCDPQRTGFIESTLLHKVLCNLCCPLSYQDFRFVTQQVSQISIIHNLNNRYSIQC
jgi:Ca2+-binding EF-hand superfamily protein